MSYSNITVNTTPTGERYYGLRYKYYYCVRPCTLFEVKETVYTRETIKHKVKVGDALVSLPGGLFFEPYVGNNPQVRILIIKDERNMLNVECYFRPTCRNFEEE